MLWKFDFENGIFDKEMISVTVILGPETDYSPGKFLGEALELTVVIEASSVHWTIHGLPCPQGR